MATPVDVVRFDDVTPEHLDGASQWELAAFGMATLEYIMATLEYILDTGVPEWTAIAVIWDAGNWREMVAERCPVAWQLAQRLTREEREGLPLTPGSHPG